MSSSSLPALRLRRSYSRALFRARLQTVEADTFALKQYSSISEMMA